MGGVKLGEARNEQKISLLLPINAAATRFMNG
jgi:hypothetical protein